MMKDNSAYLYPGLRTPFGKYKGKLATKSAVDLGALALSQLRSRYPVLDDYADELIMGMTVQAGSGVNAARVAGFRGGFDLRLPSLTLNSACLAGIDCAIDAARRIRSGEGEIYVVGGMNSASSAPSLVHADQSTSMAIHTDGVICPIAHVHVGVLSDRMNAEYSISRERQDEWALLSHQRASQADFVEWGEVVPMQVDGEEIRKDEAIRPATSLAALAGLKPAFGHDGTITAGNAPVLADGAAATVVGNADFANRSGQEPIARIVDWAYCAGPDSSLHNQPIDAVKLLLAKQRLEAKDIDLYEINEAFAGVVLASIDAFGLPYEIVNPNGGALAIGHPDAATATRQLITLGRELKRIGARRGIATLCGGGGQGIAILIERV